MVDVHVVHASIIARCPHVIPRCATVRPTAHGLHHVDCGVQNSYFMRNKAAEKALEAQKKRQEKEAQAARKAAGETETPS